MQKNGSEKDIIALARFVRTSPAPIVKGTKYGRFRPFVRVDFERCCGYCCLHESHAGGENHFELDHFQPQHPNDGRSPAPDSIINDFHNLYYSCRSCNGVKGKYNTWPSDDLLKKGISFVDLCKDDFDTHYRILSDGTLMPLTDSARYTIKYIKLNSSHLISLRARLRRDGYEIDKDPG